MATRKKIPLIDASSNLAVTGTVTITGTGSAVITFPSTTSTLATLAGTETLTNKTLTSPAINTPTGIVKGDVGLGNVDNTSNVTERAATATLTNKTLTSPTLTTPAIGAATGTSLSVSGQLTSTVATGTAPLAVTSTTKVTNLNAETVDGFNANSTATASTLLPLNATSKFPGSALGTVRLNTIESTDFLNGTALTITTWTDAKANQNFTVGSASSIVLISIDAVITLGGSGTPNVSSRLVVDSAGTPIIRYLGGDSVKVAGYYANPMNGAGLVMITGLTAGTHTVKTQIYSSGASTLAYCRCSSSPNTEFFTTSVLELGG